MTKMTHIIPYDFIDPEQIESVKILMNTYMTDRMGGVKPLNAIQQEALIKGLRDTPGTITLLAKVEDNYVGLLNAFIHFATFTVKRMINVHDVIVKPEYRGLGVGKALMNGIIEMAKEMDCSKITLEVRTDNIVAQNLYKQLGFEEGNPPMLFWTKKLMQG
ncbi:MAG: GNAT family N-acetyltransferase [Bacteroidales bacterium]|nr:GNAT family N-acetyltransferase [Bacteroidales bacterium]